MEVSFACKSASFPRHWRLECPPCTTRNNRVKPITIHEFDLRKLNILEPEQVLIITVSLYENINFYFHFHLLEVEAIIISHCSDRPQVYNPHDFRDKTNFFSFFKVFSSSCAVFISYCFVRDTGFREICKNGFILTRSIKP